MVLGENLAPQGYELYMKGGVELRNLYANVGASTREEQEMQHVQSYGNIPPFPFGCDEGAFDGAPAIDGCPKIDEQVIWLREGNGDNGSGMVMKCDVDIHKDSEMVVLTPPTMKIEVVAPTAAAHGV